MASFVSALSSIVANSPRVMPKFPPPPLFIPYGWKPAGSSCALPNPFGASFDAEAAVHPFLAISYPGVWKDGCTHRPLAQHGSSCPRLQTLLRPDPPV